jgi:hypothetical protein
MHGITHLNCILGSDTEYLPCGQPTKISLGSKPSTTLADSDSDGHEEEGVEAV